MHRKIQRWNPSALRSYILLVLTGLLVALVSYIALIADSLRQNTILDHFAGTILNEDFQGKVSGVVEADTGCTPSGKSDMTCIAIINTEIGVLHFKYTHNMANQPCLTNGDMVTIQHLGSGIARVTRSR